MLKAYNPTNRSSFYCLPMLPNMFYFAFCFKYDMFQVMGHNHPLGRKGDTWKFALDSNSFVLKCIITARHCIAEPVY